MRDQASRTGRKTVGSKTGYETNSQKLFTTL